MFELLSNLWMGATVALTPINILLCLVGATVGTLIGVLPGIGSLATIGRKRAVMQMGPLQLSGFLAWVLWSACKRLILLLQQRAAARGASSDELKRIETMTQVFRYVAGVVIVIVTGMLVLGELGISIAPLLATAGIAGIALGFGVQSLVKVVSYQETRCIHGSPRHAIPPLASGSSRRRRTTTSTRSRTSRSSSTT